MIRALLNIAAGATGWLGLSLISRLSSLAAGVALLVVPVWAVGEIAQQRPVSLLSLTVAMVILALVRAATRYAEQFLGHRAAFALIEHMRLRFFDSVVGLGRDDLRGSAGDIAAVGSRDIDRVEVFFAHTIVPAVTAMVIPSAITVWAFSVGTAPGLVVLIAFVTAALVIPLVGAREGASTAREIVRGRAALSAQTASFLDATTELRSLGAEDRAVAHLERLGDGIGERMTTAARMQGVRAALGVLWLFGAVIALIAVAESNVASNLMLAAAVAGAAPALTAVEAFIRSAPLAFAAARRYVDVIQQAPSVADREHTIVLPSGDLSLELDAVTFRHPSASEDALHNFSMTAVAGRITRLAGPSGSGKSTIVSLITRQVAPRGGVVRIGGVDIADLARGDLVGEIAVVEQQPVLFTGTVLENLRVGNSRLTEDDAWRVLRLTSLEDEIRAHPNRLDASISEGGRSLSGGQRQRLTLARALARRPRLLILDEATSHQDPATRAMIVDAIRAAAMTTLIITHDEAILSDPVPTDTPGGASALAATKLVRLPHSRR